MYSSITGCCCATSVGTSSAMAVAHRLLRARTNKAFIRIYLFEVEWGHATFLGLRVELNHLRLLLESWINGLRGGCNVVNRVCLVGEVNFREMGRG
ncbi:hypothetical protein EMIT0P395_140164 [Pseudomonas sp. IT-P395]